MPRSSMGLTLEDLRILSQIVKGNPKSLSAAAEIVGLDRARLNRLMERVNKRVGEDLDWRENGQYSPPPEVRRLALAFDRFDTEITEITSSARVSAGTSFSLLLLTFLQQQGRLLKRIALLRSHQVLDALIQDEIDVAFLHRESLPFQLNQERQTVIAKIEAVPILVWQAKVICPKADKSSHGNLQTTIEWEVGSMGERLSNIIDPVKRLSNPSLRIQCHSFLECIELVRRGLVEQAVVPDIYLRSSEPDLKLLEPEKPCQGDLIALYRSNERSRWDWLLDKQSWEAIRKI